MEKDNCEEKSKCCNDYKGPTAYCFGIIGAVIYFIGAATTFWMGVLGVLKALVWPAFVVFYLFKFLLG